MTVATPVENVLVPIYVTEDERATTWLVFQYTDQDKDPWKWPKVLKYQDQLFVWMSYDSDSCNVKYKEISEDQLATIVRKR